MASHDSEPDRRRALRIPINSEFAALPSATFISDLSEYGVFVHTPSPSPRGTKLRLRFTVLLDDPVIIEGEGRVVRQQFEPTPGMGIEFTELSPEMILRINDVISRQRPLDLGPPLAPEDDSEMIDLASAIAQAHAGGALDVAEDLVDTTNETLRRDGPIVAPASSGGARAPAAGFFRPPPRPGAADENAKTGLYQPVEADGDDAEQ